jgi:hypothetical protein
VKVRQTTRVYGPSLERAERYDTVEQTVFNAREDQLVGRSGIEPGTPD